MNCLPALVTKGLEVLVSSEVKHCVALLSKTHLDILCLVLFQPRKCPDMTEKLLIGR